MRHTSRLMRGVGSMAVAHLLPNSQSFSIAATNAVPAATRDQMVLRRVMACALRSAFFWSSSRRSMGRLGDWMGGRVDERKAA